MYCHNELDRMWACISVEFGCHVIKDALFTWLFEHDISESRTVDSIQMREFRDSLSAPKFFFFNGYDS